MSTTTDLHEPTEAEPGTKTRPWGKRRKRAAMALAAIPFALGVTGIVNAAGGVLLNADKQGTTQVGTEAFVDETGCQTGPLTAVIDTDGAVSLTGGEFTVTQPATNSVQVSGIDPACTTAGAVMDIALTGPYGTRSLGNTSAAEPMNTATKSLLSTRFALTPTQLAETETVSVAITQP